MHTESVFSGSDESPSNASPRPHKRGIDFLHSPDTPDSRQNRRLIVQSEQASDSEPNRNDDDDDSSVSEEDMFEADVSSEGSDTGTVGRLSIVK